MDIDRIVDAITADSVPEALFQPGPGLDLLLAGYEDLSSEFDVWLASTRRLCLDKVVRALEIAYRTERHLPALRRRYAEALLQLDPLHEDACRTVMRIAFEAGEIGTALRAYSSLYETIGLQLDSEPSSDTQALVAAIKLGEIAPRAEPKPSPASGDRSDHVPVVAVLPFLPFGPDPGTCWIATGLSEDLVRMLAGLREPAVISSNSTRQIRADQDDLREIGRRLGASYLVCGSVRFGATGGRVSVELLDARSCTVLWSDAYALGEAQAPTIQDIIAARIAHALAPRVNASELRRCLGDKPSDLHAYHLLLQARDLVFRLDKGGFATAGELIGDALRREPAYPAAHAAWADWLSLRVFQGWSDDIEADTAAMMQAGETAIQLDPHHARALALLGHNRMLAQHRFEEAEALLERAVTASPNDAEVLLWSSPTCAYLGRVQDAIGRAERALLLSPEDPFLFRFEHFLSLAHYVAEDYDRAAALGLRSSCRNPNYTSNLRITIAALSEIGRLAEAQPLVERHRRLHPNYCTALIASRHTFRQTEQRKALAARLQKAGL